jgi:hypothetical protein
LSARAPVSAADAETIRSGMTLLVALADKEGPLFGTDYHLYHHGEYDARFTVRAGHVVRLGAELELLLARYAASERPPKERP